MLNDIQEFVRNGAQKITAGQMAEFEHELPLVLAKVNEIDPPNQPHLRKQAEFLVRFSEDCLDGKYEPEDVLTLTEALFALMYLRNPVGIIPNSVPEIGYLDDSAVLRTVLKSHAHEFGRFCKATGCDYAGLSLEP